MKFKKMIPTIMVISMAMSSTAFAGTWKTGAEENQNKWWYDNEDGSYAAMVGTGLTVIMMELQNVIILIQRGGY